MASNQKYNIDINKVRKPGNIGTSGIFIGTGSGNRESFYAVRGTGSGHVVIYDKVLYELEMNNITGVAATGATITLSDYVVKNKRTHGNSTVDSNLALSPSTLTIPANTDTANTKTGTVTVTQFDDALNDYVGATVTISWTQNKAQETNLELVIEPKSTIPASGGSYSSALTNYTYTVWATVGGTRTNVTSSSVITANKTGITATSKGQTESNATTAGTIQFTAKYTINGVEGTDTKTVSIIQDANHSTTTWGVPSVTISPAAPTVGSAATSQSFTATTTQTGTTTWDSGESTGVTNTSFTYNWSSNNAAFTANSSTNTCAVAFAANPNTTDRTATITVSVTGNTTGMVGVRSATLTQQAKSSPTPTPSTTATLSPTAFTQNGGNATLTITSNTGWTATTNVNWITIPTTAGTTSLTQSNVAISSNPGSARTGKITVTNGTQTIEINVSQAAYVPAPSTTATLSPTGFTSDGGNATLAITSNTGWTATTNVNWITIPTTAGTTSLTQNNVAIAANTGTEARTGRITVTNGTTSLTFDIRQEAALDGYLTFNITSPGAIRWKATDMSMSKTIEYRKNGGSWVTIASNTGNSAPSISVTTGDKVEFRGDNMIYGGIEGGAQNGSTFSGTTAEFNLEGNIMSIVNSTGFSTAVTLTGGYNFAYLFLYCTGLTSAENLSLPATALALSCYHYMFAQCHSLVTPPALPATALTNTCYYRMFLCCYSLAGVPELPATSLATRCYDCMFEDCTGLTTSQTILPATTLSNSCYERMFWKCYSLTTAPALPATALTTSCYAYMFKECKKLEAAPDLPATTLADSCYTQMFYNCERLTTAPALPATSLTNYCYYEMFYNCKRIETAPVLPAPTLVDSCYGWMFNGCNRLNYIRCLATSITASDCTKSWTTSVSGSGTFVAVRGTGWILDSSDGIPRGWTILYEGGGAETSIKITVSSVLQAIPSGGDFCVALATGTTENTIIASASCTGDMDETQAFVVAYLTHLGVSTATPIYFLWKTTGTNYNMQLGVGSSVTGVSLQPWVGNSDPSLISVTGTWQGTGNGLTGWREETMNIGALYGMPAI